MFEVLDDVDTTYLDQMLLDHGLVRPVRWKKLKRVPYATSRHGVCDKASTNFQRGN